MSTAREFRPTWAEIDRGAFERNVDAVVRRLPGSSRLIAVLKANAYGHGAVEMAHRCRPDRVAMIATALLEEAIDLRRAGIELPLLVLGPLTAEQIPIALDEKITIGVIGPEELEGVCRVARDRDVEIHLKLDSGMGRMGIVESELPRVVDMIGHAPRLRVGAIYSHFANAGDPRDSYTEQQMATVERMSGELARAGIAPPLRHLANSAATMRGMVSSGDWARVGVALFGAEALDVGTSRLEPVMRWRTEIVRLKDLPSGSAIGYGATFHTTRPSRIATLPVGYADGYSRAHYNHGEVLVRGRRAPIVGRVSMDLVTIDVTEIADVRLGDEVVLLGSQGREAISVEELAARAGTISYEVFTRISQRVPRIYR
jgi:alanine racemase